VTIGLADKIVELHLKLDTADLTHAFGGAIALAYCTGEPRATIDIDVNVFVGTDHIDDLAAALEPEIVLAGPDAERLVRDGQTRLWWDTTPVDVFLSNHPFHDEAETRVRTVPFAGVADLPVLDCADLAVFKAFFARPKDVLDVATMAAANTVDVDHLRAQVAHLMGSHEERMAFFAKVADTVVALG